MNRESSLRFDLDIRDAIRGRLHPDAMILQEDRNLVMAPPGVLELDARRALEDAIADATRHRPLSVGSFLATRNADASVGWTYRAIVHDLDRRPTCRPGDIRRSLTAIVRDADQKGLATLVAEPLGMWSHRGLTLDGMVEAFDRALLESVVSLNRSMRMVLLLDHVDELEAVSNLVRSHVIRRASRSFRTVGGDVAVVEIRSHGYRLHVRFVPGTLSGYMVTRFAKVTEEGATESSSCRDIS